MNTSSNSVAKKGLPTTACTMQKEDLSIVVVDRLHYSIVYLSLCIIELSHVGYDSVSEFSYVVIQLLIDKPITLLLRFSFFVPF